MTKTIWLFIFLFIPVLLLAQSFQRQMNGIPVMRNGHELQMPWNGGLHSLGIAMPDLDGDLDVDLLLTGKDDGHLQFYRNDGNGSSGEFVLVNPALDNLDFGDQNNRLAFVDIDDDHDLDLFVGGGDGRIRYFRNDGNAANPVFSLDTDFFNSIDVGHSATPAFADLNNDGRADLLVGSGQDGIFYYTRNDNTTTTFTFIETLKDENGAVIKPGAMFYAPCLGDIDADGDLDLFVASNESRIAFYLNAGSKTEPKFVLKNQSFLVPTDNKTILTPVLVDIDHDSDLDLFFGSNHGFVTFYRNDGTPTNAVFKIVSEQLPLDFLDFGWYASPYLVDIDADGDFDFFAGTSTGRLQFYRNIGDAKAAKFEWVTDNYQSITQTDPAAPTWGDLDADGDFDLLLDNLDNQILLYKNIGTTTNAQFEYKGALLDNLGAKLQGRRPELADIDGDGDLDLFAGIFRPAGKPMVIMIYQNSGTPNSAVFASQSDTLRDETGALIEFYDMCFRLADIDHDRDLDLFIGTSDGNICFFKNIGSATSPIFSLASSSFAEVNNGNNTRALPFLADIDDDGDLDLFDGRMMGGFFFYRNLSESSPVHTQTEPLPVFYALEQNYPNPFNAATTIEYHIPVGGYVTMEIYDLLGRSVSTLVSENQSPGDYRIKWDAQGLVGGIYYYRIKVNDLSNQTSSSYSCVKKLVLLK